MGLLSTLFGRDDDLTRRWREEPNNPLLVDLDRFELNGVGVGDDCTALAFLGPRDPGEAGSLGYASRGLKIDVHEGRVEAYLLALRDGADLGLGDHRPTRRFGGRVLLGGREWEPHHVTRESDFTSVWGDPYWRDRDSDETLLFFEFPGHEVQVELSSEGEPLALFFSADPILADPGQRDAYGVTKSWPPSHPGKEAE
jgi:hypothetical protein